MHLRWGSLGAIFAGNMNRLPKSDHAMVVWEARAIDDFLAFFAPCHFVGLFADAWVFCGKGGSGEATLLHHRQLDTAAGDVGEALSKG